MLAVWAPLGLLTALLVPQAAAAAVGEPASVPLPAHKVGDTWVEDQKLERGTNGFSDQQYNLRVESLGSDTMVVGIKHNGAPGNYEDHISGLDLSQRRVVNGEETVTGRPYSFPLSVGKSWTADYINPNRRGRQVSAHFHDTWKVVGWEDVTTPAGTFHCLRVEGHGTIEAKLLPAVGGVAGAFGTPGDVTTVTHLGAAGAQTVYNLQTMAFDYAPDLGVTVKSVEEQYNSENIRTSRDTRTLVSFQHGN
jgi:hypothetical protein